MSFRLILEESDRQRTVEAGDFPLQLGGPRSDIDLPGLTTDAPLAYLGLAENEIFLQPEPATGAVLCNGQPVTTSRWLRPGDRLGIGPMVLTVGEGVDGLRLAVESRRGGTAAAPPGAAQEPPRLVPPPPRASGDPAERVTPIAFQPRELRQSRRRRWLPRPTSLLAVAGVAGLAAVAWFVFSAGSIELEIEPPPARLAIEGRLPAVRLGERWIVRPGVYRIVAESPGFRPLEATIEVSSESGQRFAFSLAPLPGHLSVRTGPVGRAVVKIDGEEIGVTPLERYELEPGDYEVRVEAERYGAATTTVTIEGVGAVQEITFDLEPLWAPVTLLSEPPGAEVRIDGESLGATPLTTELLAGTHSVEYRLAGHKPGRKRIEVTAGTALTVPAVHLQLAEGNLQVTSEPSEVDITIDGSYRGRTPLDLQLAPSRTYSVLASRVGYESRTAEVRVESGAQRAVNLELTPIRGEVRIVSQPAGAEVVVEGELRGTTPLTLTLPAVPQTVEVRLAGHESSHHTVTPRRDFLQSISTTLRSDQQIAEETRVAATPEVATGPQGHKLRLIEGGRFEMGASRREPGRRANETLRQVEITRRYYLATQEVSNRQFREFRAAHRSGSVGSHNLEIDHHPVVRVTWDDAVRYCNWLSAQAGLPPAYVEVEGQMTAVRPMNRGYRLPTEAEWAWAARYPAGGEGLKYPWGNSLPVAPDAGNFADVSAQGLLPNVLAGYDDHHATTSPVDGYSPNPLGIFNLGGNVAEWMDDFYGIPGSAAERVERDPTGPASGEFHVIRGSSWMHATVSELRISYRDYGSTARPDLGFRVARLAD